MRLRPVDHHEDDADHHVVHVQAALGLDVVEPPLHIGPDEARVEAYPEERHQQADGEGRDRGLVRSEQALADRVDRYGHPVRLACRLGVPVPTTHAYFGLTMPPSTAS